MGSRDPKIVPSTDSTYAVTLRLRHPVIDPALLTKTLKLDPIHTWKAGDPRLSQSGAPLGGQHRDSYWAARLPTQIVGTAALSLETFLSAQLVQLARHRDFLTDFQAHGGEMALVVEVSPLAGTVLTLTSSMSRRLADLNIEVEFQFPGD